MSLFTNQDYDWSYPDNLMCHIMQVIFKYKDIDQDLQCGDFKREGYVCELFYNEPQCMPTTTSKIGFKDCAASCTWETKYSCHYTPQFKVNYCIKDDNRGVDAQSCMAKLTEGRCPIFEGYFYELQASLY